MPTQATFDSVGTGDVANTASPLSWTHNNANGADMLLIFVGYSKSGSVSSVTLNTPTVNGSTTGVVALNAGVTCGSLSANKGGIWYMLNPPAGTLTIACSASNTSSILGYNGQSALYLNASGANPTETHTTANSGSGAVSTTIATNLTTDLLVCYGLGGSGKPVLTPTSPQTQRFIYTPAAGASTNDNTMNISDKAGTGASTTVGYSKSLSASNIVYGVRLQYQPSAAGPSDDPAAFFYTF